VRTTAELSQSRLHDALRPITRNYNDVTPTKYQEEDVSDVTEVRGEEPSPFAAALQHFRDETRERQPRKASLEDIVGIIRADRDAVDR
jgi:hypothetical protein